MYRASGVTASATRQDGRISLEKACKDLEGVFLSLLWKTMAKTSGIKLGGWDVLAEEAMGEKWAQAGGIGLAKVIYRSLSKSSLQDSLGDDVDGTRRDK